MDRVYNFAAGPAAMPLEALQTAALEMCCYGSTGMSVMEMSHRSKMYLPIYQETVSLVRELMHVPDNYSILLLQGGATQQFAAIPMNLMTKSGRADYIDSGNFAHGAMVEAGKYGQARCVASSREENYVRIPAWDEKTFDPEADYFYITTNNTIFGTRYSALPETGNVPLVADMSSNILSEKYDVSRFGVIYAGAGEILNLQGWTWESMAEYTLQCTKKTMSASRLAALLSQACDDLYVQKPGDDTTVAVARVIERRVVNIFTGPPKSKEDDEKLMHEFMHKEGRKIVCGGTSANIAARILRKDIITKVDYNDPNVPPMATIEGLDLVTEGVLTLGKALKLLKRYVKDEFDVEFFDELDANNGASRLAKILIEECTELNLFVGTAVNEAHQNSELSFDLSVRMNLIEQLESVVSKMGKKVKVNYY